MVTGKLYLIPTFLSDSQSLELFSAFNSRIVLSLKEFIVEDLKSARRFLRSIGYLSDFSEILFFELNEHTNPAEIKEFVMPLLKGNNMGLISEAGTPCVADPGAELVLLAHQKNISVVPLTGPNSILLALMASGLNGQAFTFHGYLPIDKSEKNQAIKAMEKDSAHSSRTQIFIETPYRNRQLFESLMNNCKPELKLCIACNLNSTGEFIKTMTIRDWKKATPDLHKKPSVFLINF
jgi:16S rRNA (cytidine1402-2'-O)-methyltransferase